VERTGDVNGGRFVLIVLDGLGIGALPDAEAYGDAGTDTLGNIARAVGGLRLPNLERLGLGNIVRPGALARVADAEACFGRMAERSAGKDSTTGHWELAGLVTTTPFPMYPQGFPAELLGRFRSLTGCAGILGNTPASGTVIINDLGDEHVRTGFPIVYTSGDSVFQIAAHESVIPPDRLYEICRITREQVTVGPHAVGRVIARPFVGTSGAYVRTSGRRDFALEPAGETVLDRLSAAGVETVAIGKIDDLFSGRGLRTKVHTTSNADGIARILDSLRTLERGFLMANLVDFDMLYGHRQDAAGFANALQEFDASLPEIRALLRPGDLLLLTADHGNDPTDRSTDHSREYVPLLIAGGRRNVDLGTRTTFADAAKTVAEFFGVRAEGLAGESVLSLVR
jgi:phosphopentomutase